MHHWTIYCCCLTQVARNVTVARIALIAAFESKDTGIIVPWSSEEATGCDTNRCYGSKYNAAQIKEDMIYFLKMAQRVTPLKTCVNSRIRRGNEDDSASTNFSDMRQELTTPTHQWNTMR